MTTENAGLYTDYDRNFEGERVLEESDVAVTSPKNTSLLVGTGIQTDLNYFVIETNSFVSSNLVHRVGLNKTDFLAISEDQYASYSLTLNDSIALMEIIMDNSKPNASGRITNVMVPMFTHTAGDDLNDPIINMTFDYGPASGGGVAPIDFTSFDPYDDSDYNELELQALKEKFGYVRSSDSMTRPEYFETVNRINQSAENLVRDIASGILETRDIIKTTSKLELTDDLFQQITDDERVDTQTSLSPTPASSTPITISVPSGTSSDGGVGY